MNASFIHQKLLPTFGLQADDFEISQFGSGLINQTWKLKSDDQSFIFQQINQTVFKSPEAIATNLQNIKLYLLKTAPNYLFVAPLPTLSGDFLIRDFAGDYFRLFPFVDNSHSVDTANHPTETFEAAKQFGKFTRLLENFDLEKLQTTIPNFHNLELRFREFEKACAAANPSRKEIAKDQIQAIEQNKDILETYQTIVRQNLIPLRAIHHDTKINNVLFDATGKGLCVIDLDTVMPGYFLSDVGDMMRTYLSPANEEETDFSKIIIRKEFYQSVFEGYMSEMQTILTSAEKQYFFYAGKMMVYMQAIRFLSDFLNGDVYYHTTYPNQNLIRAKNQLTLLEALLRFDGGS